MEERIFVAEFRALFVGAKRAEVFAAEAGFIVEFDGYFALGLVVDGDLEVDLGVFGGHFSFCRDDPADWLQIPIDWSPFLLIIPFLLLVSKIC